MRTGRPRGFLQVFAPCIAAGLVLVSPAGAFHVVFDYKADRFELSGAFTLVDEFDDGSVAPWTTRGTVAEADGLLSLTSPGVHLDLYHQLNSSITLDVSDQVLKVISSRPIF